MCYMLLHKQYTNHQLPDGLLLCWLACLLACRLCVLLALPLLLHATSFAAATAVGCLFFFAFAFFPFAPFSLMLVCTHIGPMYHTI